MLVSYWMLTAFGVPLAITMRQLNRGAPAVGKRVVSYSGVTGVSTPLLHRTSLNVLSLTINSSVYRFVQGVVGLISRILTSFNI